MRVGTCVLVAMMCVGRLAPGQATAEPAFDTEAFVRAHYAKYEYRVPMRDGIKLFVSVYVPPGGNVPGRRATTGRIRF